MIDTPQHNPSSKIPLFVWLGRHAGFQNKQVATWCLQTYTGMRPYMVKSLHKRTNQRSNQYICSGRVTSNTTYLGTNMADLSGEPVDFFAGLSINVKNRRIMCEVTFVDTATLK